MELEMQKSNLKGKILLVILLIGIVIVVALSLSYENTKKENVSLKTENSSLKAEIEQLQEQVGGDKVLSFVGSRLFNCIGTYYVAMYEGNAPSSKFVQSWELSGETTASFKSTYYLNSLGNYTTKAVYVISLDNNFPPTMEGVFSK